MSPSAIGKWVNPPKYQVPIHRTIVQKGRCHPQCLPTLTKNMQAAIDELSMLLKYHVKCISPPGPSVLLTRPQSTWDQTGVHSPSVSALVVFHWQVSILTSSLSSRTLQSVSSGAPHPVELLCFCPDSMHQTLHSVLQCICTMLFLHSVILCIFRCT